MDDVRSDIELDLAIDGMTCAACVRRVERAIARVPGVSVAEVNLATERARVRASPAVPAADLLASVQRAGYTASVVTEGAPHAAASSSPWPVLAAAFLSTPLLLGMVFGWMLPAPVQCLLASLVLFGLGARFYVAAWRAIRAGTGSMDVLIALGATAAWGLSTAAWLSAAPGAMPSLYYESASLLVTFVLLGKWLEARAKRQAASALRALDQLRPQIARVLVAGAEIDRPLASLRPGDHLVVRPGERIAADGRVLDGESAVDFSMLTGESDPVPVAPGGTVTGGALNLDGRLVVSATALGAESTLARIVRLVESAQASKPPIQRLVDRVSAIFVPVVIGIACLTFLGWWLAGAGVPPSLLNAVSVLVIACPCALGLATPAAIVAGTGAAARSGILIRDAETLERASAVTLVAFDKTGTLTEGRPALQAVEGDPDTLRLAAALLAGSEHPLAAAVRAAAPGTEPAAEFRALPGRGVSGRVNGRALLLGSARLMRERGIHVDVPPEGTTSFVAEADPPGLLGRLLFADPMRPGAARAIAALAGHGIETMLLTGDNRAAAARAAGAAGIGTIHADLLPEDKAALVQDWRRDGHVVAMVGDGINDAPALAASDVGIALGSGTDLAKQVAGITIMRGDPGLVPASLDIARRTRAKIRQGLFWAFAYNVIGIPLAASGWLSPAVAGAAMALSSLSVVANALTLRHR